MPGVVDEGGSGDGMYFSWNYGPVHFLSCDSETPIDTANFDPPQLAWMAKDLKRVNRKTSPWVVANFHRPMYCQDNDSTCGRQATLLKTEAEKIFHDNEVNAVIAGHVHAYERFSIYVSYTMLHPDFFVYNQNLPSLSRRKSIRQLQHESIPWSCALHARYYSDVIFAKFALCLFCFILYKSNTNLFISLAQQVPRETEKGTWGHFHLWKSDLRGMNYRLTMPLCLCVLMHSSGPLLPSPKWDTP